MKRILPVLAVLVTACSNEEAPDRQPPPSGSEWSTLIEDGWTLPPGGEATDRCTKVTLQEDVYISAVRPVHPLGTHHTFLALSDSADGERCTPAVATGLIYAAGLGSQGLELPEGVAMHFMAGQVLNLSLHLYNVSGSELTGTSGIEVKRMDPADVVHESGPLLAGPVDISIPPGRHTLTHECSLTEPQTAYAIFPHMHQLGVHFKTTIISGGTPKVLHDADYDFKEQAQLPISLELAAGDRIATECTYENPGTETVTFGESSNTEMCFTVLFRYPRLGTFCRRNDTPAPGSGS